MRIEWAAVGGDMPGVVKPFPRRNANYRAEHKVGHKFIPPTHPARYIVSLESRVQRRRKLIFLAVVMGIYQRFSRQTFKDFGNLIFIRGDEVVIHQNITQIKNRLTKTFNVGCQSLKR